MAGARRLKELRSLLEYLTEACRELGAAVGAESYPVVPVLVIAMALSLSHFT
jgi:hypothetical protein